MSKTDEPTLTINDFSKICRTCSSNTDLKYLFENIELLSMLESFTQLQFSKTDGLPDKICTDCVSKIRQVFAFINNCRKTDETFKQIIQKPQNETETKDEEPEYPIQECFIKEETPTIHENTSELIVRRTKKKAHKCQCCAKVFNTSSDLKKHERIHSGERPYRCTICPRAFTQSYNLKLHQTVHMNERPLACDACEKSFKHLVALRKHKKMLHGGDCPPPSEVERDGLLDCETCGKVYLTLRQLKRHRATHEDKKFKCGLCEKSFNDSGSFIRHRRIHSGERPYVCAVCQKAFNSSGDLRKHGRVHSGERPYKCPQCPKAFKQTSALLYHKTIHKIV